MHLPKRNGKCLRGVKIIYTKVVIRGVIGPEASLIDLHLREINVPPVDGDMVDTHIIAH